MQLNSIDMMLNEGVYDPGIFKVFILRHVLESETATEAGYATRFFDILINLLVVPLIAEVKTITLYFFENH